MLLSSFWINLKISCWLTSFCSSPLFSGVLELVPEKLLRLVQLPWMFQDAPSSKFVAEVSLTKDILGKYEAKCNRSSNLTQSNCRRLRLATLWRLFQHLPFQKQDGACSPQLDTKPGAPKEQGAQEGRIAPAKNKCYNVSAAASSFASAPGLHGVHRNNRNPDQTISQSWPIL